jgi:hypothetical protein
MPRCGIVGRGLLPDVRSFAISAVPAYVLHQPRRAFPRIFDVRRYDPATRYRMGRKL